MMCLDQGQKFLLPKRTKQHVVRLACMASSLNGDWNVRKTYNEPLLPLLQDLDSQHVEHGGRDFAGSTRENLTRE
jgi:hypothetical protein